MTSLEEFLGKWRSPEETILVHTSGSTGSPKPLRVEKCRMEASARRTCSFLGLRHGDTALLCMPLDYIAGMMMVVRAEVCGLELMSVTPSGHPLATVDTPIDFAAMVPMQVFNSMQVSNERERLMRIRHLIIGGGAIDESLENELRGFPNAVWSTYGMTETLSHIALRRISGAEASRWYTPFDSVTVSTDCDGCLIIDAPEVCPSRLVTNDRAELSPDGRQFKILGRKDNVICSGGIKIQIEEVEQTLRPHISSPFVITRRRDSKFGEIVAMLIRDTDTETARRVCESVLPQYHRPRIYIPVESIPLTPTGKPARAEAERIAAQSQDDKISRH